MRLLIVTATEGEAAPLRHLPDASAHAVEVLVTGVGMVATAAHVARALARAPYDAALNLGVCGAFDRALSLGAVVHVVSEGLPELGAEDGDAFLPADALGLLDPDQPPFRAGRLVGANLPPCPALDGLPRVTGVTVNTVHGHTPSIDALVARLHPQVESMEGAAFAYACLVAGVPFAQVRAVSNYVERRNRAAWKIADALAALTATARAILAQLSRVP